MWRGLGSHVLPLPGDDPDGVRKVPTFGVFLEDPFGVGFWGLKRGIERGFDYPSINFERGRARDCRDIE